LKILVRKSKKDLNCPIWKTKFHMKENGIKGDKGGIYRVTQITRFKIRTKINREILISLKLISKNTKQEKENIADKKMRVLIIKINDFRLKNQNQFAHGRL